MNSWKPFVELKIRTGKPIKRGQRTVTPETQSLVVKLPYMGFVWNRPVAVVVEEDGRRERFPIIDVTRAAVLGMAASGVLLSFSVILAGWLGRKTAD